VVAPAPASGVFVAAFIVGTVPSGVVKLYQVLETGKLNVGPLVCDCMTGANVGASSEEDLKVLSNIGAMVGAAT